MPPSGPLFPASPPPLSFTLPGQTEAQVNRLFLAPRQRVFGAHTTPALLQRWLLGPPDWEMADCHFEPREGGSFRYVWREMDSGDSFAISGRIAAFEAPSRIVHSEVLEMPGQPPTDASEVTTLFDDEWHNTRMVMIMRFPSAAARHGAVASGMMEGMEQSYQNLDVMLAQGAEGA